MSALLPPLSSHAQPKSCINLLFNLISQLWPLLSLKTLSNSKISLILQSPFGNFQETRFKIAAGLFKREMEEGTKDVSVDSGSSRTDPGTAGHWQLLPGGHFISKSRHWPRGFHEVTDLSEGPMTHRVAGCKPLLPAPCSISGNVAAVCFDLQFDTSPLRGKWGFWQIPGTKENSLRRTVVLFLYPQSLSIESVLTYCQMGQTITSKRSDFSGFQKKTTSSWLK